MDTFLPFSMFHLHHNKFFHVKVQLYSIFIIPPNPKSLHNGGKNFFNCDVDLFYEEFCWVYYFCVQVLKSKVLLSAFNIVCWAKHIARLAIRYGIAKRPIYLTIRIVWKFLKYLTLPWSWYKKNSHVKGPLHIPQ